MFIEPNEHIIIMEQRSNHLTHDELLALRDIGIKTVSLTAGVQWHIIQPCPDEWHHHYLDNRVREYEAAGIKALIGFVDCMPRWKPDDWYYEAVKSPRIGRGFISYQNPQVAEDIDNLLDILIDRYSGYNVQFIYAMPSEGEFPFPIPRGLTPRDDDYDFAAWVVERQRRFEAQYGEIWTAFHHTCSPTYLGPTLHALRDSYPDSAHYGIQYSYWRHGRDVQTAIQIVQQNLGIQYYVGSEFINGIEAVTPHAIRQNLRLITCPIHTYQSERRLLPYMIDKIADSLRKYDDA